MGQCLEEGALEWFLCSSGLKHAFGVGGKLAKWGVSPEPERGWFFSNAGARPPPQKVPV